MAARKPKRKKPFLERLVYKPELMDRTGAAYMTILADIEKGLLAPGRKIGGFTAWKESEVLAYIDALPPQRFYKKEWEAKQRERAAREAREPA